MLPLSSALVLVAASAGLVSARPTPASTSWLPEFVAADAAQNVVTIQVGGTASSPGGVTVFSPNLVVAPVGSVVSFQFTGVPGNHSVTQSSFAEPCQPLANGFDSGWVFVNQSNSQPPEWNITITDDRIPLWFFCKQLGKAGATPHCNNGMVGAINVGTTNKTLNEYISLAKAQTSSAPGQSQNGFTGVGAQGTAAPFLPAGAKLFNSLVVDVPASTTAAPGNNDAATSTSSGQSSSSTSGSNSSNSSDSSSSSNAGSSSSTGSSSASSNSTGGSSSSDSASSSSGSSSSSSSASSSSASATTTPAPAVTDNNNNAAQSSAPASTSTTTSAALPRSAPAWRFLVASVAVGGGLTLVL